MSNFQRAKLSASAVSIYLFTVHRYVLRRYSSLQLVNQSCQLRVAETGLTSRERVHETKSIIQCVKLESFEFIYEEKSKLDNIGV